MTEAPEDRTPPIGDRAGWSGPPPESVCIVMLSAIGDAVHVLPVVTALKRAWPTTRITWIVQPGAHALVDGHPDVDELIVFRRRRGPGALAPYMALRRTLRGRRFDLVLGLQVYLKAGLVTALVPAEIKLGFDRARAADGQWLFTNRRIPPRPPRHVQDQYFEFLTWLGVDPEPIRWRLELTEEERRERDAYFGRLGAAACALVVGTSKSEKNWHPEGYARVAEHLVERHGLVPVIVGGPSVEERRIADRTIREARVEVRDELGDDLRRLVWLLDGSALVVSPDTGPMHIARALGTPVVSLFGYTNPKRYGPYGAFQELIVDGYAEHADEEYPPTRAYRDGMRRVTVERVTETVDRAVRSYVGPGETEVSGDR